MIDDAEGAPLMGGSKGTTSKIVLGLIIAILVFSFFAFVFATASFASTKNLNSATNNNFYNSQGGLISDTYTVPPNIPAFDAGTVLSFCDTNTPSGGVCPGLGPRWNQTLYPSSSLAPAIYGDLAQMSPDLAFYVAVSPSAPSVLRLQAIRTSDSLGYTGSATLLNVTDPISWLSLRAVSDSQVVIAYTCSNNSFIVAATVTTTTAVTYGTPFSMFSVPATVDGYPIDVVVLKNAYVLVTYGPNSYGASFTAFTVTGTTLTQLNVPRTGGYGVQITNALSSTYLGNSAGTDYLLQATGDKAVVGTFLFAGNSLTISALKTLTYENVLFESITATSLFNGYIALAGVQTELLQNPLTVSMVLQWSTTAPYLTSFFPSNLLQSQRHQLINNQLSVCYAPATNGEPRGELFFSYVDSVSDRAKIIRAKIATTEQNDVQLLPSPPLDISTFTYTRYGISIGPLVACPNPSGVLVAYQYLGTYFNTFMWQGGYRFAGIAQQAFSGSATNNKVIVLRQGISDIHASLQPGFPYYLSNSGRIHAHSSIVELFTGSSYYNRLGVALTDTQLLLDEGVFDYIAYGEGN